MLAYHNDPLIKVDILAQLAVHRAADQLVQGYGYWEDGKGCAVGCTLHSGQHVEYEHRFGIPQMLAHLEDRIFEGLPAVLARAWPERFMAAIEPGVDLSRVGWRFLHWLLTDETVNPGIRHPAVCDAVEKCAGILVPLTVGAPIVASAASAAASAAWSAAWSAAESAESAESAAASAARSAESAARSAESAAASAAWSAAESAESAAWSAESAAYVRMSDKMIDLLEAC